MKKNLLFTLLLGATLQAQVTSINENFNSFTIDNLPQNGWTSDNNPFSGISINRATGNKYLKAYSLLGTEPVHLMTPELQSVNGKLTFDVGTSGGSLEVGLVENTTDMTTFEKISDITVGQYLEKKEVNIPQNTKKYIAFKFLPSSAHTVIGIDNVVFTPTQLAVGEIEENKNNTNVFFDINTKKLISVNEKVKSIQVYNIQGQIAIEKKQFNKEEDLSVLSKGVYVVVYENENNEKKSIKIIVP